MTKVDAKDIYGFEIDNTLCATARIYLLPSYPNILIGNDKKRIKAEIATASNLDEEDHDEFFEQLNDAQSLGLEVVIAIDSEFDGKTAETAEKKLVERLKPYQHIVQRDFTSFFDGKFAESEYIQLLAQCSNPQESNIFVERCLKFAMIQAEKSLKQGQQPNYQINVAKLVEDMSTHLNKKIEIPHLPEYIIGKSEHRVGGLAELFKHSQYVHAIVQENGSSFTYTPAIQEKVSQLTKDLNDDLEKSKAIFDWITTNIIYGKEKRPIDVLYRGASRVYEDREGVCGESASLQVTMERLAGNIAFLVEIGTDHACAAHIRPTGELILIDTTTPLGFNAKYKEFKIISDNHSLAKYH